MILPQRKDLDKAKQSERKSLIDDGLSLAKRVDALREQRLQMEVSLETWRKETVSAIQSDIDNLINEKETTKQEVYNAKIQRDKLQEPLDSEWIKLNKEKEVVYKDRNELFLDRERFVEEVGKLDEEREDFKQFAVKIKQNETDSLTTKSQADNFRRMAQSEYDIAHTERETQAKEYETKLQAINQRAKEYEVGIQTIEVRESQVKDKESELLVRENDVARRIKILQRHEK